MAIDAGRALSRTERGGAIATDAPSNPWASAGLLKPYAGGAVHEAPKVDALATITAGYKNDQGFPVVSRDGTIYVRGADRAPGLIAELARRGNRSLTVALVHNDPKDVLQQWFASYSKTRLESRGDAHEITIIHLKPTGKNDRQGKPIMAPDRETVRRESDPERYALLASDMKVQTSLYFALATWEGDEPKLIFPDGLGLYRLHFTSLNSAEAIKSQLSYIASLTSGRVAGVPLELSINYRNLAGPDGVRRDKVPIWSLILRPPETITLSPARVASILQSGIEQARSLAIAAPSRETLELAEYEGPDVDLDDARIIDGEIATPSRRAVERLAGGGPIQHPDLFIKGFMIAGGPLLRDDDNRRTFMLAATSGRYSSLKRFAEEATAHEGADLMDRLARWSIEMHEATRSDAPPPPQARPFDAKAARSYDELFRDDDGAPATTPAAAPPETTAKVHASAVLLGARPVPQETRPRPEEGNDYSRAQWEAMYAVWAAELQKLDAMKKPIDVSQLVGAALPQAVQQAMAEVDELERYFSTLPDDEPDGDDDQAETVAF